MKNSILRVYGRSELARWASLRCGTVRHLSEGSGRVRKRSEGIGTVRK